MKCETNIELRKRIVVSERARARAIDDLQLNKERKISNSIEKFT